MNFYVDDKVSSKNASWLKCCSDQLQIVMNYRVIYSFKNDATVFVIQILMKFMKFHCIVFLIYVLNKIKKFYMRALSSIFRFN